MMMASRSADSSMAASRSASSSRLQVTPGVRSVETAALIPARGAGRGRPRRAGRYQPVSFFESSGGGLDGEPFAVGHHGEVGGERGQDAHVVGGERTAAQDQSGAFRRFGAGVGFLGCASGGMDRYWRGPPTLSRHPGVLSRPSSAVEVIAKVSRTRSSSAAMLWSPRSSLVEQAQRVRFTPGKVACTVRRAAVPTTDATETATSRNSSIAVTPSVLETSKASWGGVK